MIKRQKNESLISPANGRWFRTISKQREAIPIPTKAIKRDLLLWSYKN